MRRPRSDSKLDALELDQQRQLCEWLLTPGLSYKRIKEMVLEEFKVSTNLDSLSVFYQSYVSAYLIQRRAEMVGVAKERDAEVRKTPGAFSPATLDALEEHALRQASNPLVNPKDVNAIYSLVLKAQDQSLKKQDIEIKLRRLEILEKQASEAKEKLTAVTSKGGLSKETLQQIEAAAKLL